MLYNSRSRVAVTLLITFFLLGATNANADIVLDNITGASSFNGAIGFWGNEEEAAGIAFTVQGGDYLLNDVDVVFSESEAAGPVTLSVGIYEHDGSFTPGAAVGALQDIIVPSGSPSTTFNTASVLPGGIPLSNNTTYWFVISYETGETLSSNAIWESSDLGTPTGQFQYVGMTFRDGPPGDSFSEYTGAALSIRIGSTAAQTTPVPLMSSLGLALAALLLLLVGFNRLPRKRPG